MSYPEPPLIRPPTPQSVYHRSPLQKSILTSTRPSKYIVLILASTSVSGKVQIASQLSQALACPLYHGDSLFESCSKSASVAMRSSEGEVGQERGKQRFKRMWFNKMTRTGLLFPEESRPVFESKHPDVGNFPEGESTEIKLRRDSTGSTSSFVSAASSTLEMDSGSVSSSTESLSTEDWPLEVSSKSVHVAASSYKYVNRPVLMLSKDERSSRDANPALMVLTHPELEDWHESAVLETVREYGIGVIFVPLDDNVRDNEETRDLEAFETSERWSDNEIPPLQPLNPTMIRGFTSFDALQLARSEISSETYNGLLRLRVKVDNTIENIIEEVLAGVREIMFK